MPKVPRYDQNNLASSLVGTPGVDTSGGQLFNTLASEADQAGQGFQRLYAQDYQTQQEEIKRKQAEVRAAEKAMETAKRSAEVSGYNSGYGVELNAVDNQLRQRDNWNTDATLNDFSTQADELMQKKLDAIQDPLTKLQAQKAFNETKAQYSVGVGDWVKSRAIPIIGANIKGMESDLETKLSNSATGDWNSVDREMQAFEKNAAPLYAFTKGEEGRKDLRDAQNKAMQQRIADIANKTPELLDGVENNPVVQKYTDPNTFHAFLKDQRLVAAQQRQAAALEAKSKAIADNLQANQKLIDLAPDGDLRSIGHKEFQDFKASSDWVNLTPSEKKEVIEANKRHDEYMKAQSVRRAKLEAAASAPTQDKTLLTKFGSYVNYINNLGNDLQRDYSNLVKNGKRFTPQDEARLQRKMDQYKTALRTIDGISKSVTTPTAKQIVAQQMSGIQRINTNIDSYLRNSANALAESNNKQAVRNKVLGGKDVPEAYSSDPRKTAMFNFYFNNRFEERYAEYKKQGKLADLYNNKPIKDRNGKVVGAAQALYWELRQYAGAQVEGAWNGR